MIDDKSRYHSLTPEKANKRRKVGAAQREPVLRTSCPISRRQRRSATVVDLSLPVLIALSFYSLQPYELRGRAEEQ
jgi:hypothetical protein